MRKQILSVGVADMDGFDPLTAALGWERAVGILQESLGALGEIVVRHEGQIRKYLGDALLFSFIDPREAVRAADEMARYRLPADGRTVRFFVGLATGEVLVTPLGHGSSVTVDIFGDTVTRAFRLIPQAKASERGLALDDETRQYE